MKSKWCNCVVCPQQRAIHHLFGNKCVLFSALMFGIKFVRYPALNPKHI